MERYHADKEQARRVETLVRKLLPQVTGAWGLPARSLDLCAWAARLHEIGLDIAHSHYHKHGAYVIENSDMPGFSRQEQQLLAALVRAHRRKFPASLWKSLPAKARLIEQLAILLRLSVLLHRSRTEVGEVTVTPGRRSLEVQFAPGWLEAHPLTQADLLEEAEFLGAAGFDLRLPPVVAAVVG
jgi:exopolyphosphatase/guanosine-5'-triphosphate,3'-diphosphate pyrophosphatase